jgi:ABC-type lipoprotein export system ATPase subunit
MNLEVKNISKSYTRKKRLINVIDQFSYNFDSGKLYVIKGQSGKGKTTLITLLALLQKADSGEIFLNGTLISTLNEEEKCLIRRDKIGIVFQDFSLFERLTVLENIICVDVCMGKKNTTEVEKKAEDILELLNLKHRIFHYANEISGGEQQRTGIARAIIKDPDILICDEPISNLDSENSDIIVNFINQYCHEKNKIVIVTSHSNAFDDVADEIIYMK